MKFLILISIVFPVLLFAQSNTDSSKIDPYIFTKFNKASATAKFNAHVGSDTGKQVMRLLKGSFVHHFNNGDDVISSTELKEKLDNLIKYLSESPKTFVRIQSHSDNSENYDVNMQISQSNADKIEAYIISKGIEQSRIIKKALGPVMPIAPNTNDEGRKRNRRIEVELSEE